MVGLFLALFVLCCSKFAHAEVISVCPSSDVVGQTGTILVDTALTDCHLVIRDSPTITRILFAAPLTGGSVTISNIRCVDTSQELCVVFQALANVSSVSLRNISHSIAIRNYGSDLGVVIFNRAVSGPADIGCVLSISDISLSRSSVEVNSAARIFGLRFVETKIAETRKNLASTTTTTRKSTKT